MKKAYSVVILFLTMFWILGGCSNDGINNSPIKYQIQEIKALVDGKNWSEASMAARNLKQLYEEKKWKLQLLGDETEYEGIDREIDKLSAAIEEKEPVQIKLGLAQIHTYLKSIYLYQ
jgi:hypothetical protein